MQKQENYLLKATGELRRFSSKYSFGFQDICIVIADLL